MTEGRALYTFVFQAESEKGSLVKQNYSTEEIEGFKKQAENLYYYMKYHFEDEEDRYHFQPRGYEGDRRFLEIPIEDYVIEAGSLVGFYPYHSLEDADDHKLKAVKRLLLEKGNAGDNGVIYGKRKVLLKIYVRTLIE